MPKYVSLVFLIVLLAACKTENKNKAVQPIPEPSILEKIANAHGYGNWKNVSQIRFTFNVDRDTSHFERSWQWETKTNNVVAITATDTLRYNRKNMDSLAEKTNGSFINDKYWLLAPYNLVWDKNNFSFEHTPNAAAPIGKKPMQKLTIVYGNEGGYTPGDAYDFFFEDDFIIKEWVFRRANAETPTMTTTWENYISPNGLKIGTTHNNAEGNFKLHFTNIIVETE